MSDEVEIIVPDEPVIPLVVAEPGPPGAAGGANSNTVLYGSGAPNPGTGADGNFYIRTSNWTLYGPKAAGSWPSPVSLIGPQGDPGADGADGAAGADGRTIHNGAGAPDNGTGSNGDFYIKTGAPVTIYGPKAAGVWPAGQSLVGPQGSQGDQGVPGADGDDGAPGTPGADGRTLLNGTGAPSNGTGANGDFYIDTSAWFIYGPKASGTWPAGVDLNGADGADGSNGAPGADGKTVLNGTAAPTTEGVDGDFYVRTSNWTIYGPKTAGAWGGATSLVGPAGSNGSNGSDGADGNTVLYGTAAPTTEGVDGDFYIRTTTNYIYGPKASGTWPAGTSLVGPTGADGPAQVTSTSTPSNTSGTNKFFRQEKATWSLGAVSSPDGNIVGLMNAFDFWNGGTRTFHAGANAATPYTMGFGSSVTGTNGIRSMIATDGWYGQTPKISYTTAATNNAAAGTRHAVLEFWRGDAAGLGGFLYAFRVSMAENASDSGFKYFGGLSGVNTAITWTSTEPDALTNIIGLAKNAAHTTFRIIHNDALDTATSVDLGANFPCNTSQTDVYDVYFYAKPNGDRIYYQVDRRNADTGAISHTASGELTSDLPSSTTRLSPIQQCGTGTGSPVTSAFDLFWQIMWTPY